MLKFHRWTSIGRKEIGKSLKQIPLAALGDNEVENSFTLHFRVDNTRRGQNEGHDFVSFSIQRQTI
jgi:hypothetical protein